ncbi:hypothetical protein TNCV_4870881, partial [Trichonephila clavipes]
IMFASSYFVNPTPLAHADAPSDNHPKGDYHDTGIKLATLQDVSDIVSQSHDSIQ